MQRKTSMTPTRIWTFGASAPLQRCAEAVDRQFLAGRVYRNNLIKLEIERRVEYRKILCQRPECAAAQGVVDALFKRLKEERDAISMLRAKARNRRDAEAAAEPHKKNVTEISKQIQKAMVILKKERAIARKQFEAQIELLDETVRQQNKDAYKAASQGRSYEGGPTDAALKRQAAYREILNRRPEYVAALDVVTELLKTLKLEREAVKAAETEEAVSSHKDKIALLEPQLEQSKKLLKKELTITRKLFKEDFAQANAKQPATQTENSLAPLFWGTKLLTMKAHEQICKSKNDPRLQKWDGKGRIGVQMQEGYRDLKTIFDGTNAFLRIDLVPASVYASRGEKGVERAKGFGRRAGRQTFVHLCIGDKDGKREFVTFPVILHRPLPEDAKITWAWVKREKVGTNMRYEFQVTVESRTFVHVQDERKGVVAFDIGWRQKAQERRRVAYWYDDSGRHGEIILPEWHRVGSRALGKDKPRQVYDIKNFGLTGGLQKVEDLRSIRDRLFNEARLELVAWMKDHADTPEWFRKAFQHVWSWKSANTMGETIWAWRDKETGKTWRWSKERFAGDEEIFAKMDAFRKQSRHLYQWESNEREQTLARRKDFYRNLPRYFAKRYKLSVWEDFDLSKVAKLAPPEKDNELHATARHNRHESSLSELRGLFKSAMPVELVPPEHTTTTCHKCNHTEKFNAKDELVHKCPKCGESWDQDFNAAVNILTRYYKGQDEAQAQTAKDEEFVADASAPVEPDTSESLEDQDESEIEELENDAAAE